MTSREEVDDAAFGALCKDKEYSNLDPFIKIFRSVSDPQTATISSRHLALARYVVYQNAIGWKIESFELLNKFLQLLRDKILNDQLEFLPVLHDAIELCCKPFRRFKSNEELAASERIGALLRTLSQLLLVFQNRKTQKIILAFLLRFTKGECLGPINYDARSVRAAKEVRPGPNACNLTDSISQTRKDDLMRVQKHCQLLMREANVVYIIVQLLEALSTCDPVLEVTRHPDALVESKPQDDSVSFVQVRDTEILYALLCIIDGFSTYNPSAEDFVALGGVRWLVVVLDTINSPKHEFISPLLNIFSNLLQSNKSDLERNKIFSSRNELLKRYRVNNAMFVLANETSVASLMRVMVMLVQFGSRDHEKHLRNDCMIIIYMLSQRHRAIECYHRVGLTSCLLSYATSMEIDRISSIDIRLKQIDIRNCSTASMEDFEFKCILWRLIVHISCNDEAVRNEVIDYRFVEVILQYVKTSYEDLETKNQNNSRNRNLAMPGPQQYDALRLLATDILSMWSLTLHAHFAEIGGYQTLLALIKNGVVDGQQLEAIWQLFSQFVCSSRDAALQDELGSLKAVDICVEAMESSAGSGILSSALIVASELCRKHSANTCHFQVANGVHQVLMILEKECVRSRIENGVFSAAIHAVRSCIIGNATSELIFLGEDGVTTLLDAMCVATKSLRNQILAALVELAVNPAFVPSFTSWKSSKQQGRMLNAVQLLLQLVDNVKCDECCITKFDTMSDGDTVTQSDSEVDGNHVNEADVGLSRSFSSSEQKGRLLRPSSAAFNRLEEALEAAHVHEELGQRFNYEPKPRIDILPDSTFAPSTEPFKNQMDVSTIRVSIIFSLISAEALDSCALELSVQERLLLEGVKEYVALQTATMWKRVHETLHHVNIRPIYADAIHIQKQIEIGKATSLNIRRTQRSIAKQAEASETEEMEQFYDTIRQHRNQNIQAQYHSKHTKGFRRKLRSMPL
ncbi:hypothetical protein ABG067_002305 [Albugo candida]